jgi:hypothetical protein
MSSIDHDVSPGHLEKCQVCGSSELELVLDVGHQPLCDSLLTTKALVNPEITYPLRLFRCIRCTLTQLDYVVPGDVVYAPDYPYRSGITQELAVYQRQFAKEVADKINLPEGSLCVDIGSNDGTLLTGFKKLKMRALGVEPTNIGDIARVENGIETLKSFFTESLVNDIVSEYGKAKVVTTTNVFAHMAPLGEVMRGIKALLDTDGVFVTESHYLLDVLQKQQYDTIYHEHIRTYSLKSLVTLFEYYDMEVFDVKRADRYGGNIRAYVCNKSTRPISRNVIGLLTLEKESGLEDSQIYNSFRDRAFQTRDELMELAYRAKTLGQKFVGNSCPGRCSTLLNFCGMNTGLMPYLAEQPSSLKLDMFLPGMHIPIVENSILVEEQPDFIVLLAWHYAKPIVEQLRKRGVRSKFVMPLPNVEVLSE